ncbi:dual specificity protein kinase [Trichophyton mentagrophytes]|uniref:CMGC/DYRK/YAK protein kinase n=2 Tax=Trichophyton TaxID=5550 RepID=A0A059J961_TRIIM|nr:CMGC/DYRK/YAK protein kinase [Trichophyton tonsurans CBS 112818]EZF36107.1 CMGC/DYRK/YAK protein kinase [Trichophyton interdigitale H6]KDB24183.1 CMGC/DYRK/YAK protein kinase [Trichophyton interdigitale MR816]GBF66670.1 dual specificity protein kinase [Trichophyton mentagrophytes]
MEPQWQNYSDIPGNKPGQFTPNTGHSAVDHGQTHQPPRGFTYETYQPPGSVSKVPASLRPTSMVPSPSGNGNGSGTPNARDLDHDTHMEDADPYNRAKYSARPPTHQRNSSQYLANEETSSAARRYSPMNIISPTLPYNMSPNTAQNTYGFPPTAKSSSHPSPTSTNNYSASQSYQSPPSAPSRPHAPRLPPMQSNDMSPERYYPQSATLQLHSAFGQDSKSHRPVSYQPQSAGGSPSVGMGRGPVPKFQSIKCISELQPRINKQPAFRRANPEGGFISPLQALTTHLPATYRICNPTFKYESSRNPRRVLTKPSKGVKNDGYDNDDSDYILYVNDILGSEEANHKNRYLILDVLGQGTFGQVVKCQNLKTQEVIAVKVIKNRTAYFNQSMMEVSVLDLISSKLDKNDDHHLLRLKDTFIHRQHLCLVFELLSVNLYELIKQNQFRGLSTTLVRVFAQQLLNGLALLNKARLIHCDLKPENILLKNLESPIIKIIDFGSACDERQTVYTYIQSRFYRSPEVLLGLPYSSAIDMWSLGCIVVELFLGLPLFPGSSEYNQIARITEMLGLPPVWMLENGKQAGEFFEKTQDEFGRQSFRLKSMEQYSREHNTKEQPSKKYFQATTLPEIIRSYAMPRKNMKQAEIDREMNNRVAFIDFVRGLLSINPLERWSPQQAKLHPFITQQKFTQPFVPPVHLKSSVINKSVAPGVQQQQQAEAASKQRAQAAQAQAAQAQANSAAAAAAQSAYALQMNQFNTPHNQPPPVYNNMYNSQQQQQHPAPPPQQQPQQQQGPPPPYPTQQGYQMPIMQSGHMSMPPQQTQYGSSQNLYAQATTRAGRQRATTMDQQQSGIPPSIQRVASHLDPNSPIRLQPSPAYYPPPADGYPDASGPGQRRTSRARNNGSHGRNRDFIRSLEDGALGDGFMNQNQNQWH